MLDLDQAVTIARAIESAEQEVELMAGKGTKEDPFVLNHLGTTTIFLSSCGIKHIRSAPYYPRSNGKVERFHRYLKKNLRSAVAEGKRWEDSLNSILMTYRASPHIGSGQSPAKLMLGREIRTKLPDITLEGRSCQSNEVRDRYDQYQERMKNYHDKKERALPHNFKVGDKVLVANRARNKLDSRFARAPHIIKEKVGNSSFIIQNIENGKELVRNQKHLRHIPQQHVLAQASQNRQEYVEFDFDFTKNVSYKENDSVKIDLENNVNRKKSSKTDLVMANEQLEQCDNVTRTRSGRIVKSTKNSRFVYY